VDSKRPDAQAAHEFTLTAMLPALAGVNLIYGLGMLDSGMTWDYAQAVMHNEILRMVTRAVQGIPVSDAEIAMDVIKAVGPGGEFITHRHTLENMKRASRVTLFDRNARDAWETAGSPDIVEKAYEKAADIIARHQPDSLPEDIQAALNDRFDDAENAARARRRKK